MVKLAVISDSHWGRTRLEMFAKHALQEKYDAVLFLGDGLSDVRWLEKTLPMEVRYVSGNCDPFWECERELRLTYGGVRILMVHGDQFNVKFDLSSLSYHAEEACCAVALFGHTHKAFAGCVGHTIMVNPGALIEGRYAELQIDAGTVVPYLREL